MCFIDVGQAGAIRHALSNALGAFSDDYYQTLDNGKCFEHENPVLKLFGKMKFSAADDAVVSNWWSH